MKGIFTAPKNAPISSLTIQHTGPITASTSFFSHQFHTILLDRRPLQKESSHVQVMLALGRMLFFRTVSTPSIMADPINGPTGRDCVHGIKTPSFISPAQHVP